MVIILVEVDKIVCVICGDVDVKLVKIYFDVYSKDFEFYGFLCFLRVYEKLFSEKSDILVLDFKSDFFKYMNNISGVVVK